MLKKLVVLAILAAGGCAYPPNDLQGAIQKREVPDDRATAQVASESGAQNADEIAPHTGVADQGVRSRAARNVNMRVGPGTNYAIVRTVRAGEEITVLRVADGWCEYMTNSGVRAYVSCSFLSPPPGGWASLDRSNIQSDSAAVPSFRAGTPYPQVRQQLLRSGWTPNRLQGAGSGCAAGDERCRGFPETVFCAGTGRATCIYTWRRRERYLLIHAVGETPGQEFDAIQECSDLRVDPRNPSDWWTWCQPVRTTRRAVSASSALSAVQAYAPGWTLLRANQFCGADARSSTSGDFNGDGRTDYAARLARGSQARIVAFMSDGEGYRTLVLEEGTRAEMDSQRLAMARRGSRHFVIDSLDRPRRPITLPTDAPVGGTCESSSYIYLIDGMTVSRAFTSD